MAHCTSCGIDIPDDQGNSCSMCYGDIAHGHDGYYEQWAREQIALEEQKREECGNIEDYDPNHLKSDLEF